MTTISQVRALSAPARAYLWELLFPTIPQASRSALTELTLRARNVPIPGIQNDAGAMSHFKGHEIPHPGKRRHPHTLPITFEEGLNYAVYDLFWNWNQYWIDDVNGGGGDEATFKVPVLLRLLDTDQTTALRTARIVNAWPSVVPDVALAYANSDLVNVPITLTYEYWEWVS